MGYSELIKNFNKTRDYMHDFYVYGFKSRDEFTEKSARSYDDERRRVESWLGDYMKFRQTPDGKNAFISINSRVSHHNPLYNALKAKTFTDGDITLHFILFDILSAPEISLSLKQITKGIDNILSSFSSPRVFDESTVRKKLNEYIGEGIITAKKQGKTFFYSRSNDYNRCDSDILDYFSEVAPCGVIGSFLLDKTEKHEDIFSFKHHYITGAMDSEVLCSLFDAMTKKRFVCLKMINRNSSKSFEKQVVPLKIMISVQNGRQYLMAYLPECDRIRSFRTDDIISVCLGDFYDRFDELRATLSKMLLHTWGVSTQSQSGERIEHIEFTVKYNDDEQFIHRRLEREKRCGTVEKIDKNTSRFFADVYDSGELVPWIRTFICRITSICFSNKQLEAQFKNDIEQMYRLYGLGGR